MTTRPATLDGFEVELTASPVDNLLINFSLGQNEYENTFNDPASDELHLHRAGLSVPARVQRELGFPVRVAARQRRSVDAAPRRVLSVRAAHGTGQRAARRLKASPPIPARGSAFRPTRS